MPEVSVRGRSLGYEAQPPDFGRSSLSLVFIHGSGGDREDWRQQLDGLSDLATVIALELPGHGASDPPGESSVSAYADWVVDFVESLGLEKIMVIGCSLGSAVTQWLALSPRPWLVGIGLVGAGARLRVHPQFVEGILENRHKALETLIEYCLSPVSGERLRSKIRKKYRDVSAELIRGDLIACNEFDVMERVGEISVPTCILVGEDDKLTPVKYSIFLHDAINGSRFFVIPKAGHLVMMERPREFNMLLGRFIEETGLVARP